MLYNCVYKKHLCFWAVLIESWCATKEIMLAIDQLRKIFYCPLKVNRQVDDCGGARPYQRVDSLEWKKGEKRHGKAIKVKGFPGTYKVKLLQVVLSTQHTDSIVTNERTQDSVEVAQEECSFRWKFEQCHCKTKQLTSFAGCQCRKARVVCNLIGCAILVWNCLKQVAYQSQHTIYQVKTDQHSDYLRHQLNSTAIQMTLT